VKIAYSDSAALGNFGETGLTKLGISSNNTGKMKQTKKVITRLGRHKNAFKRFQNAAKKGTHPHQAIEELILFYRLDNITFCKLLVWF